MDGFTPLFTIVTITYNSSRWVRQAIESVLSSEFTDFEYIIADDSSTDNSWEIIKTYKDPRIKTFRHEKNIGEYNNRNFALEQATGKYLLFVDGDDELYNNTLDKLSQYIEQYQGVGSIWGLHNHYFPSSKLPILLQSGEMIKWVYMANYLFTQIGFSETVFNVEVLKNAGGFSTKYISGDIYIKKKIAINYSILLIPAGMMMWRQSEGQASSKLSKNYRGFIDNVNIDKGIIAMLEKENFPDIATMKRNIAIRNIKLLVKHTFRKFKIRDGLKLFKQLGFTLNDFRYLFVKGDYTYRKDIENS